MSPHSSDRNASRGAKYNRAFRALHSLAGLPTRLRTSLCALIQPRRFSREIDDEIAFHLDSRTQDLIRSGLAPREAARQARIEFGSQAAHADSMRRAFGVEWITSIGTDVAYAIRLLRRSPSFTAITVLSLALAIGANSAIFSTANEILFTTLNVPHSRELRTVEWTAKGQSPIHMFWGSLDSGDTPGYQTSMNFTYPLYRQIAFAVPAVFAYKPLPNVTVTRRGESRAANVEMVSGNFFASMQVVPVLGRPIAAADDHVQDGTPLVALLSYGYWQREFGGSPTVLGSVIDLDGAPATIVGVTPRGFTGASSAQITPNLFVPLTAVSLLQPALGNQSPLQSTDMAWVFVMLRVAPHHPIAQLSARLSVALAAGVRSTFKLAKGESVPSILLIDGSRGLNEAGMFYTQPLSVLLALTSLVLLLACVNVANLMLARSTARERELSVRMALGAQRTRLFRQVLTECLLLSSLGGALGLLLAFAARDSVPSLLWNASQQGGTLHIPFDWPVFAFTGGVTVIAALLSGIAPAWRATRLPPGAALQRTAGTSTRRRMWGGKLLVGAQITLSTLLVAGAVMFVRSITNLDSVRPGFDPHHLLMFDLDLPQHYYSDSADIAGHEQILAAVRAVPGVESASLTSNALLGGFMSNMSIRVQHTLKKMPQVGAPDRQSDTAAVGTDYLQTMHIPLSAGRTFRSTDMRSSQKVAVVTQAFAARFFGRYTPIGQRFSSNGKAPWTEIIGVCNNIKYSSLREPSPPVVFTLYTQKDAMERATYLIRSKLPPNALIPSLRRAVAQIDPNLPLTNIRTQNEQIRQLTQQERLFATLTTGFGLLAISLACAGVYGVFSYAVTGRTREIGIRLSLGAPRRLVRTAILREALTLSILALVAGLGITVTLLRLVHSLLYGVSAADPLSLTATALLLLVVALLAAWLPAARASAIDPMQALRHE